jgi:anti-sigma regulatory factor (Ser/Thr protein kinase)
MTVGIQQRVPADPRCVREVRRTLWAFMDEHCPNAAEIAGDVALAVSEACGNVVRHAYPGGDGDVMLSAWVDDDRLVVAVADAGVGFRTPSANRGLGLGMRLIQRLADADVRYDGGTLVEMRFPKSDVSAG